MKSIDLDVKTKDEARSFIGECEDVFGQEIDDAIKSLVSSKDTKIVTLSGPTCSGKTTTAKKLTEHIETKGRRAVVMSIDDFFIDRNNRNVVNDEAPDYDTVKAIDIDYFAHFTERLMKGESVLVPTYDFIKTARTGYNEYIPNENDIYVFEGIQAVYPEISSLLGRHESIFICVNCGIRELYRQKRYKTSQAYYPRPQIPWSYGGVHTASLGRSEGERGGKHLPERQELQCVHRLLPCV